MQEYKPTRLTSIRLPESLHRKAKAEAANQGISLSKLITQSIERMVN
ncbi:hicB family protein [Synechococcus sp. BIOS-E4-1]|nr:toxin-antitoxin system HicB family antitoxin [Synechococcus sp. BIOS-E4-1]QNI53986.1 hicB family protein [Synechococcus sp. BIOS-E4-1]